MAGADIEGLHAGWVVAMRSDRGLVLRRRWFSDDVRKLRLLYVATLAVAVAAGHFAPFFFVAAAIIVVPVAIICLVASGSERAAAPWIHILRSKLEVRPLDEDGVGYRSASPSCNARVITDGHDLGATTDVHVKRRKAERGDAVAYCVYLLAEKKIALVTVTSDPGAARDVRQLLRDAAGLERKAAQPSDESYSLGIGCWSVGVGAPFALLVIAIAVSGFLHANERVATERLAVLAGAALAIVIAELVAARILALIARRSSRAWVEQHFGARA